MKSKIVIVLLIFMGVVFALVPSWVQPGVSITYDGFSAYVSGGQYYNPINTQITITVNSATENVVSGTTYVENVLIPGYVDSYPFTCYEGQPCDWLFWVDPANPAQSAVGPNGETYSYGGSVGDYSYESPYTGLSYSTEDSSMLLYQNAQTGIEYHIIYETKSGLVLSYAEIYPSQETYLYITSINVDLSDYEVQQQPDQDGQNGQQNGDGQQLNGQDGQNGGDQQNGGEDGSQAGDGDGGTCGSSAIILLVIFIVLAYRRE